MASLTLHESARPLANSRLVSVVFLAAILLASTTFAQSSPESPYYARANSFGVFSAYSNDSSHILMGHAENRKLFDVGVSYSRKLFLDRVVNWQYSGEILPVALESDPLGQYVNNQTSPTVATTSGNLLDAELQCEPITTPYSGTISNANGGSITYSGTQTISCSGRQWNIGEAMSPAGFQWNFLPRRKSQPFFVGHGGYMYSTRAIPLITAGSFNFTFDLGAGVEHYRSKSQSIRAEYRFHHISNHGTAYQNPGIDNGLFQITYSFGR